MAKKTRSAPEPPAVLTVSALTLRDILQRQDELRRLRKLGEVLEASIKRDSKPIIELLEVGAVPDAPGVLVSIKVDSRRNVKWADEFAKECGEAKAAMLRETCEPSITKSLSITDTAGAAGLTITEVLR